MATQRNESSWTRTNITWLALGACLLLVHGVIQHLYPGFTPPYLGKPAWMKIGLQAELAAHIVALGVVLTSIRNAIPALKNPQRSDDAVVLRGAPEAMPRTGSGWKHLMLIAIEAAVYATLWVLLYLR